MVKTTKIRFTETELSLLSGAAISNTLMSLLDSPEDFSYKATRRQVERLIEKLEVAI